ncbi:reverse transcriptase domain-containing protein [Tanacetum coccineum]|uniref:Reverse transcriptase domain-containing protein n=1 Tax=Tanacetum coccineum TaxID=301880 RepID=A0ABQ5HUT3_9ASTR
MFVRREEKETAADFLVEIPSKDNEKKEKPKEVPDSNNPEGKEYTYALRFEFGTTNNEAEYEALLAGTFAAKQASIKEYLQKVKTALKGFEDYTVEHVRMNQNKKADTLSKLASMTFEHLKKEVLVEVLTKRSIEEKEVLKVDTHERNSWMDPIHEYLLSGLLPEDTRDARKIRIQALQYKLIQGNLFKRSLFTPWLRCVAPPQTDKIIKEIHKGSCGFNAEPRSLVVRITKQGFYWPSMHREVAKAIQDCEKCKEQSAIRKAGTSGAIAAGSTWPFSHWGIHIIGPLPMAPGGLQFLAIAVEHSKKWVEAKPLTTINGRQVEKFVWEYVLTRSQQGWVDNLAKTLWIHRTLLRNSEKETPFSLTYGSEAVIPIIETTDDRGRVQKATKGKESKEVASIEKAYY